jgi:hypothetical protein
MQSTIAWLWLDPKLPKPEYKDALYQATKWAKTNAQEYITSVNFDYDKEPQKGDSCFGLKPCQIVLARKK